jgi:hypothetical protein
MEWRELARRLDMYLGRRFQADVNARMSATGNMLYMKDPNTQPGKQQRTTQPGDPRASTNTVDLAEQRRSQQAAPLRAQQDTTPPSSEAAASAVAAAAVAAVPARLDSNRVRESEPGEQGCRSLLPTASQERMRSAVYAAEQAEGCAPGSAPTCKCLVW